MEKRYEKYIKFKNKQTSDLAKLAIDIVESCITKIDFGITYSDINDLKKFREKYIKLDTEKQKIIDELLEFIDNGKLNKHMNIETYRAKYTLKLEKCLEHWKDNYHTSYELRQILIDRKILTQDNPFNIITFKSTIINFTDSKVLYDILKMMKDKYII